MSKQTKYLLVALGVVVAVVAYRKVYHEKFVPVFCSSRSNNCADLGSREQVSYA